MNFVVESPEAAISHLKLAGSWSISAAEELPPRHVDPSLVLGDRASPRNLARMVEDFDKDTRWWSCPSLFSGKHVAILASHGVEESEITFPYEYLISRGAQVDILVPSWASDGITAVRYLKPTLWVKATGTFKQAIGVRYDLLVLTGGAWNAQVVRSDSDAVTLISEHYKQGFPICSVNTHLWIRRSGRG